jgi:hypothetical protein
LQTVLESVTKICEQLCGIRAGGSRIDGYANVASDLSSRAPDAACCVENDLQTYLQLPLG